MICDACKKPKDNIVFDNRLGYICSECLERENEYQDMIQKRKNDNKISK